jgi:hypothetical protein
VAAIGGEAVGEHAAGAARAHHDVVERTFHAILPRPLSRGLRCCREVGGGFKSASRRRKSLNSLLGLYLKI